jgi:hypothetical protein
VEVQAAQGGGNSDADSGSYVLALLVDTFHYVQTLFSSDNEGQRGTFHWEAQFVAFGQLIGEDAPPQLAAAASCAFTSELSDLDCAVNNISRAILLLCQTLEEDVPTSSQEIEASRIIGRIWADTEVCIPDTGLSNACHATMHSYARSSSANATVFKGNANHFTT